MKAILYCRVKAASSRKLLEQQKKLLTSFSKYLDVEIVDVVELITANEFKIRKVFNSLIQRIQNNQCDIIIADTPSRIADIPNLSTELCQQVYENGAIVIFRRDFKKHRK